MQPTDEVARKIQSFVLKEFPLARGKVVNAADPLLDSGIIDSLGVLQLVAFVEREFGICFADEDMVSSVFESIESLSTFVASQRGADSAAAG